jgi:hypothetical protein
MSWSSILLLAAVGLAWPGRGRAQQSFFNVPSVTGTLEHRVFLQEQLNLSLEGGESNFTASTGVGRGFEVGLNIFHVDVYGDFVSESARDMFMANVAWTSDFSADWTLQAGVQGGVGRNEHSGDYEPAVFSWAMGRWDWHATRLAFALGAYAGTEGHLAPGWPAGPMAAVEWVAVPSWLVLQADVLMGNHESAYAVGGLALLLPHGWQIALGMAVPSPKVSDDLTLVVEITRVPELEKTPAQEQRVDSSSAEVAQPEPD